MTGSDRGQYEEDIYLFDIGCHGDLEPSIAYTDDNDKMIDNTHTI